MNKQEFLNYSLGTGLKILRPDKKTIKELSGIHGTSLLFTENRTTTYGSMSRSFPILRPLSDLTKSIEHDGEVFVPMVKLGWSTNTQQWSDANTKLSMATLNFHDGIELIKWKFDIANLIENGEAIDINTLENFKY